MKLIMFLIFAMTTHQRIFFNLTSLHDYSNYIILNLMTMEKMYMKWWLVIEKEKKNTGSLNA